MRRKFAGLITALENQHRQNIEFTRQLYQELRVGITELFPYAVGPETGSKNDPRVTELCLRLNSMGASAEETWRHCHDLIDLSRRASMTESYSDFLQHERVRATMRPQNHLVAVTHETSGRIQHPTRTMRGQQADEQYDFRTSNEVMDLPEGSEYIQGKTVPKIPLIKERFGTGALITKKQ